MNKVIRIIGIDPGLRHTGWGVIDKDGSKLCHLAHGVIKIDPSLPLAQRLGGIFSSVRDLVAQHCPNTASIEETVVNRNPRQALKLGQARGAALAALAFSDLPVDEYAPRLIKKAVTGTGNADKNQVMFMVTRLLPRAGPMSFDAADALACAICTAHHMTGSYIGSGKTLNQIMTEKSYRI